MIRVVIVGGGISGALVAVRLAQLLTEPTTINVIEPRETLGAGVAYSATDPAHRINVPAARMSVFAEDPEHFARWLARKGAEQRDPAARWRDGSLYPQRRLFGAYVAELVEAAGTCNPAVTIRHVRDRVADIEAHAPQGAGYTVHLRDAATTLRADVVVLAVTHPPPALPAPLAQVQRDGAPIIADPWQAGVLETVPKLADVLVVGTGLTMADVVATLERRGHQGRITAVSRRGLLSRGHPAEAAPKRDHFATAPLPRTALALCIAARAEVRQAHAQNVAWQAVLDDLRANGTRLWTALPPQEQRRLVRHLRPYWDVHRFRIAPQVEAAIARLRAQDRFTSRAAYLQQVDWDGARFHVRLRPRGAGPHATFTVSFDQVVVTTGPDHGGVLQSNPALASLAVPGLLRPDQAGLGLDVDEASHAVGAHGTARADLLVAGPLARGRFGELMGLPQVAGHADDVAQAVARHIKILRAGHTQAGGNDAVQQGAPAAFQPGLVAL